MRPIRAWPPPGTFATDGPAVCAEIHEGLAIHLPTHFFHVVPAGFLPRSAVAPGAALSLAGPGYAGLAAFAARHPADRGVENGIAAFNAFDVTYVGALLSAAIAASPLSAPTPRSPPRRPGDRTSVAEVAVDLTADQR